LNGGERREVETVRKSREEARVRTEKKVFGWRREEGIGNSEEE